VPAGSVATSPGIGSGGVPVGVADEVPDAVDDALPDADALVDVDPVAEAEVLDAGAEKDVLVDGDCVGVEDRFALVVGWAEWVARRVFGAVPTLVPEKKPLAEVAGSEPVVGTAARAADCVGDLPGSGLFAISDAGVVLLVSRMTMIAMSPQAARPAPTSARVRRRARGSGDHP
jgi:hypothetical protein